MGIFRNKKYMDVKNVRLFYDEKSDQIRLTSTDPRILGGLNLLINPGRKNEVAVRNALIDEGIIPEQEYQAPLPSSVEMPESATKDPMKFPIGQGTKGIIYWEVSGDVPQQLIVAGVPGSGKTILQKNLLSHAQKHALHWDITIASPHNWKNAENSMKGFNEMDAIRAVSAALEGVEQKASNSSGDVSNGKRQLVFIEEYDFFAELAEGPVFADGRKEAAHALLHSIDRLMRIGRSRGISIVVESFGRCESMERLTPFAGTVIGLGRIMPSDSQPMFGVDVSNRSFEHRLGRGLIRHGSSLESVQAFSHSAGSSMSLTT